MSFAALKRRLVPGTVLRVEENNRQPTAGHLRTIVKVQTNAFSYDPSEVDDAWRAKYRVGWMYWPKANLVDFDGGDEFTVYFDDSRTHFARYKILDQEVHAA